MKNYFEFTAVSILLFLSSGQEAQAYIDPGSGSIIMTAILGFDSNRVSPKVAKNLIRTSKEWFVSVVPKNISFPNTFSGPALGFSSSG